MTFLERTTKPDRFRAWKGDMEADYRYTSGVAGERFFTALRDTGKLLAARCPSCDIRYLPPRMYCEDCFGPLADWSAVDGPATVETVSVVHVDAKGTPLPAPQVWAILRWKGIRGGLVHRLATAPERAKPGLAVRPVLRPRPERVGNITDIMHFAP